MSSDLYAFAIEFARGHISADDFADEYIKRWKEERDAEILTKDPDAISLCLSSIFCLSDSYNPSPERAEYELDELQLRKRIKAELNV